MASWRECVYVRSPSRLLLSYWAGRSVKSQDLGQCLAYNERYPWPLQSPKSRTNREAPFLLSIINWENLWSQETDWQETSNARAVWKNVWKTEYNRLLREETALVLTTGRWHQTQAWVRAVTVSQECPHWGGTRHSPQSAYEDSKNTDTVSVINSKRTLTRPSTSDIKCGVSCKH